MKADLCKSFSVLPSSQPSPKGEGAPNWASRMAGRERGLFKENVYI